MNELQLHSRLSTLADDLAPGDDPFELVAGARALHRRRRRTRIGVAGAALAVALVVVGVPTAVNTLSSPDRGDVAGPDGTPEELRQELDLVRGSLDLVDADATLPDSENSFPCPDGLSPLTQATRLEGLETAGINAGGGTLTGCGWSTDPTGAAPPEDRVDAQLLATFDTTAEQVRLGLEEDVTERGCRWATVPGVRTFAPLSVCTGPQTTWTVTVLDEDGTGAWRFSAAVGANTVERAPIATRAVATMWQLVQDLPGADGTQPAEPDEEPRIHPLNDKFNAVVIRFEDRSRSLDLDAPAGAMSCPEPPVDLGAWTGVELVETRAPGSLTCTWASDAGPAAGLSFSVGFTAGASPRVYRQAEDVTFDGMSPGDDVEACFGAALPNTEPSAGLAACQTAGGEEWRFDMADAGGDGMWAISLSLPSSVDVESPLAFVTLTDMADARW